MTAHLRGEMTMKRPYTSIVLIGLAALAGPPAQAQDAAAPAASVRIGIVLPKAQLGQGNSGQDVGEPVRQLLMSYMAGPMLELVPLQAKIAAQVDAEAQAQNCTHVLYTSVEQKKAGKGMGGMLGMLGPAASMLPGVGALGGNASMIAGVATQAISTAAIQSAQQDAIASLSQAQAGSVKARDEISLTYQFVTVGGFKPTLEDTLKAKAKENGEDLLRPLAEQVATKTVSAALAPQG
jgi:hypothetical protein